MDRRRQKTRLAVYQAFTGLLEKKTYSAITVQEIIDEADIGRSTFYSHFETKDDLLKALCTEIFEHVFSEELTKEKTHDFSAAGRDLRAEITHILYLLEEIRADLSDPLIQAEHLRKHGLEGTAELVEFQKRFGYCKEAEEVLSALKERFENGIYSLGQLAVSGADLTEIPPAKRAGILENLLDRVILEELPNKREVLLEEIAKMKNA